MTQMVTYRLTDLLSHIVDNRGRSCPTAETGFPLIATNCVKDDRLYPVFENVRHVNQETYTTWFRDHPEPGDVLFVCKGSPGRAALVPDPVPFCIAQDMVALRADPFVINNRYLYYQLSSVDTRRKIENMHVGTMIPHFKKGDFHQLQLTVHQDIGVQVAIAEVLGVLDDTIAANDRLATTVEEYLAVRFTAVTANAPVVKLSEVAQVNPGKRAPVAGSQLRYVDISSVQAGRYVYPHLSNWDTAPGRARREVRVGDTLWSTVRPNRRSHALNLSDDSRLVASTGLAVLRPEFGMSCYFYEATRQAAFTSYLENVAEGSTYPAVRADRFEGAPMVWADEAARSDFEAEAAPLRHLLNTNEAMNRALAGLRDSLLPRLMSGELRVRDAEKVVEAAL